MCATDTLATMLGLFGFGSRKEKRKLAGDVLRVDPLTGDEGRLASRRAGRYSGCPKAVRPLIDGRLEDGLIDILPGEMCFT